jgi:hypothetical protein
MNKLVHLSGKREGNEGKSFRFALKPKATKS